MKQHILNRFVISLLVLFGFQTLGAQILTPVKWETTSTRIQGDIHDLTFTAIMDKNWAIYSQHTEEGGPVPTSFNFEDGDHFTKEGPTNEKGELKEGMDDLFGVIVKKFPKGPVVFTQRVKVDDYSKPITGYLEYMTCDNTRCLPPTEVEFSFDLKPENKAQEEPRKKEEEPKPDEQASTTQKPSLPETNTSQQNKPTVVKSIPSNANENTSQLSAKETVRLESEDRKETSKENSYDQNASHNGSQDKKNTETTAQEKAETKSGEEIVSTNWSPKSEGGLVNPVKWDASIHQLNNDEYELRLLATLEKGWAIYSQHSSEAGPVPTYFEFEEGGHYSRIGEVEEDGKLKEAPEPLFDNVVVKKYKEPVTFRQKLKISDPSKDIKGFVEFMACDDSKCTTPAPLYFAANLGKGLMEMNLDEIEKLGAESVKVANTVAAPPGLFAINAVDLENPVGLCGEAPPEKSKSLWGIFILGFLGGLIALLTPCVFPMIPLTVSFFTKGGGETNKAKGFRDAAFYGFSIFLVYILFSLPFHLLDSVNPDILNNISTNVYLNIFFFLIFVYFAFSFFGYYEISLPSWLTNKVSAAEGIGGTVGIFFMAATLALVSFSCTGPILGSLLAGALTSEGGAMQLTSGMGGFGLALAMPFAVFAAFPSLMEKLPQSGGWMTTTKVILGFIELALAFKFLSNADMVKHWGALKYEVFLAIWIAIGIATVIYLLGKIKFPHDPKKPKVGMGRIGLAVLFGAFTIYLMTGFRVDPKTGTYKPLTLLSGILPPVTYSWLYPKDCPADLDCFKDLKEGMAYAKEVGKPVMLDFTGYACFNCRKMEENVWSKKDINKKLKDEYVVISLYVDDRAELKEEEQIKVTKSDGGTRTLRNKGHKWSHFQAEYFDNNSQPWYVLLSPDGKLLNQPVGYTPAPNDYEHFLDCGIEAFKEISGEGKIGAVE